MKRSSFCVLWALLSCLLYAPICAYAQLTTLHSFDGSDGTEPAASLIQGSDGLLYGTTEGDYPIGYGSVFSIDLGTSFSLLYLFPGPDVAYVGASLIEGTDGNLYATTYDAGANDDGMVFEVGRDGTGFTDLYDFGSSSTDGEDPAGGLIQGSDGNLYGTTFEGGANGNGTIFKIPLGGGSITYLHSFGPNELSAPGASLIEGEDGSLYGTYDGGGPSGMGGVFRINLDGSGYSVLHSFAGEPSDGGICFGALIEGGDGFLYGVTSSGGADNDGTVFKIEPDGTGYQTIHSFSGGTSDGQQPNSTVALSNNSNLYGTTVFGGANGYGTIFQISRDGSVYNSAYQFDYTDGSQPYGGLIQATDGNFYGTTTVGGANGDGTIFSYGAGLPASPTGLYALGSDAQVQLAWNTDTNADPNAGYNVYRSTTSGGEGDTAYQSNVLNPQFTDNNVTNGTQYFYQVTAIKPDGTETAKSYEVTGTPLMAIASSGGLTITTSPVEASTATTGTVTLQGFSPGATPVFLSSSDPSATFDSPTLTLAGGQGAKSFNIYTANTGQAVTATITASENGTDATAQLQTTVPPTLHTFDAGLQMIAAPADDTGVTLANLFAQNNPPLAVWTGSSYVVTPTAPANDIVPGQGYWAHPASSVTLYDLGDDTVSTAPIDVSLSAGWNMIGDPMNVAAPASGLEVMSGGNTYSFADANLAGRVGATFYTWQPGDSEYETVTSTGSLQPFIGYWVYAFKPCTLIFPAGG